MSSATSKADRYLLVDPEWLFQVEFAESGVAIEPLRKPLFLFRPNNLSNASSAQDDGRDPRELVVAEDAGDNVDQEGDIDE